MTMKTMTESDIPIIGSLIIIQTIQDHPHISQGSWLNSLLSSHLTLSVTEDFTFEEYEKIINAFLKDAKFLFDLRDSVADKED